jgi:hypothetical protein
MSGPWWRKTNIRDLKPIHVTKWVPITAYRLLQQAVAIEPTRYKNLIQHVRSGPEHNRQ